MLPPLKLHHQDNKVVQDQYVQFIDASLNPFYLDIYSSAMDRNTDSSVGVWQLIRSHTTYLEDEWLFHEYLNQNYKTEGI
jgi:hypothetical protein